MREPTDAELDALLAQPTKIEQLRSRLSSLSWFMARWKEPIACVCNSEMDTSGHFWEGRFHSRELLDEEAVLTCSFYVDLNQVRAGLADSLEASRHSAIFQRIVAADIRVSVFVSVFVPFVSQTSQPPVNKQPRLSGDVFFGVCGSAW